MDTLFALSSGAGKAGVAVVRISGPKAGEVLSALAGRLPAARRAVLTRLTDPRSGVLLDRALVLWLPGPASFTGEDCAELHLHGGRAVVAGVLSALAALEGLKLAEPGAFTRRAFDHGKLDLTGVEALADLIDAETEMQRVQALRLERDGLGARAEAWRSRLLRAMAQMEAGLDFSDEMDVAAHAAAPVRAAVATLLAEISSVLDDARRGEIVREGYRVAIIGAPNVGKSSLLNALAARDVAIVADEPGTTRDVLDVRLDLGGHAVVVSDTAGLRAAPGAVEREGVRRALAQAEAAQLVLWVRDATRASEPDADEGIFSPELHRNLEANPSRWICVLNKIDLVPALSGGTSCIGISARTGEGLAALVALIAERARQAAEAATQAPLISRVRQRTLVAAAQTALGDFLSGSIEDAELRAEDLRRAGVALGRLTGRIDVEDVLGEIFSRFCIGK